MRIHLSGAAGEASSHDSRGPKFGKQVTVVSWGTAQSGYRHELERLEITNKQDLEKQHFLAVAEQAARRTEHDANIRLQFMAMAIDPRRPARDRLAMLEFLLKAINDPDMKQQLTEEITSIKNKFGYIRFLLATVRDEGKKLADEKAKRPKDDFSNRTALLAQYRNDLETLYRDLTGEELTRLEDV